MSGSQKIPYKDTPPGQGFVAPIGDITASKPPSLEPSIDFQAMITQMQKAISQQIESMEKRQDEKLTQMQEKIDGLKQELSDMKSEGHAELI